MNFPEVCGPHSALGQLADGNVGPFIQLPATPGRNERAVRLGTSSPGSRALVRSQWHCPANLRIDRFPTLVQPTAGEIIRQFSMLCGASLTYEKATLNYPWNTT